MPWDVNVKYERKRAKKFYKKSENLNKRLVFEIAATNTIQYTLLDR